MKVIMTGIQAILSYLHHINREHFAKYGVYLPVENFISTE